MIIKVRTDSVEATQDVAAAIERYLRPGDLLLLSGELGGGKTAFVQGLAIAMGVNDDVTSPTFVLAQTYEGRLKLHHLDAYRLETPAQLIDLNLTELLDDHAVIAIEWGERVLSEVPRNYLLIQFNHGRTDEPADVRLIEIEPVGRSWESRAEAIATSIKLVQESV